MAHGTPSRRQDIAPFYTRIRRGRPPSPEQLAELEDRYAAIGGLSPLTERTQAQVDGVRAELERRAPGRYVVAYGAKHAAPLIEEAVAALTGAGVRAGHRSRAHPPRRVHGLAGVPGAGRDGDRRERAPSSPCPPGTPNADLVALLAERVTDALAALAAGDGPEPVPGGLHRPLAAGRASGSRVTPTPSSWRSRRAWWPRRPAWRAGRWPGRAPAARPSPGSVRTYATWCASWRTSGGCKGVVVCPIGFVTDHLEVLYDLDVELAAVATEVGLPLTRTASLNDDRRFIAVLADVVMAAAATPAADVARGS